LTVALRLADIYEEIARMYRSGSGGVVATVVSAGGSTPRGAGAKMIVYPDGRTLGTVGGGAVEADVIAKARALVDSSEPELLSFDLGGDVGMACGGEMSVFLEPIAGAPRVAVIGGGHVGQAVAAVARQAGFRVTVVDDRREVVSVERFPTADRRLVGGVELLAGDLPIDESSFVVIVTRGHRYDKEWLRGVIALRPGYLGMIGSAEKVRRTFEELEREGVPKSALEDIHAPIGIDIGAETPDEIAVSVVAEIIAVRHGVSDTAMLREKPDHKGRNRP
jgi:xanthine dehydrogenase accessory factor